MSSADEGSRDTAQDDPSAVSWPAGLVMRLAAIGYDALLLLALWIFPLVLITVGIYLVRGGEEPPQFGEWFYRLYMLGIAYLFFVGFWLHAGQTAGMRAWRLRIVTRDGNPPTLGPLSIRFFAALASWIPFGLGFWVAGFDPERRTFHDWVSGTRLLRYARQTRLDPKP